MKKRFFAAVVFMFLFVSVWVMADKTANNPVTVSPGSETEVVTVWQSCPTFSWSAVDQAASYRVAVFESVDATLATYEAMAAMASPAVSKDIPGPALSWTLSADEKLKTGGQYTWYVQALDVTGNPMGPWSGGRIFRVEQELRFAGISEKLGEVLKSYGVKDETITNVLTDMKSEVQEVVVSNAGGKNTPGLSGVKGTEGVNNTFYGQNAGAATTGSWDTFIGASAGVANTTGYSNTFVGFNAGNANTTANSNCFFGYRAGYLNTSGSNNIFLGSCAGYSNTTGYSNIFIGNTAGNSNINGTRNIFIGSASGYSNISGSYNTFVGYFSGYRNDTGVYNVFFGNQAGWENTSGNRNVFIGYSSGYCNTTGQYNVFLGYDAGLFNTTAGSNVFIGSFSGNYNTTGEMNACMGDHSGYHNDTGYQNTFLGYFSGYNNIFGYGNTCIGDYAGFTNQSGSQNIFLGHRAGYNETGSNKLYIANSDASFPLIYGDFGSTIVAINGYLGIGRQVPSYPIHMASGAYCSVGGTWTNASSRALKENIQNLSVDEAVEALTQLNPVKYNYKVDKADKHVGFIAEDVPDLVASSDRKGLSPMDVTAVLTKVVQELQKENQEQQNLILQQQKVIIELQKRMAKLEKN